jgi:hypothetical protein
VRVFFFFVLLLFSKIVLQTPVPERRKEGKKEGRKEDNFKFLENMPR